MSLVREYVSASVNRYTNTCDWGDKFIAFASCNAVVIYDVKETRVQHLLLAHCAEVRCVRWIVPDQVMVSGSADKSVIIWKSADDGSFQPQFVLTHELGRIIAADSCLRSDGSYVTVTSATDFTLTCFVNDKKIASTNNRKFAFDVRVLPFPSFWETEDPVVVYATDDKRVNICHFDGDSCVQIHSLSGHTDWSRSLDFHMTTSGHLLLGSASQDCFVRVWKIERKADDYMPEIGEKIFKLKNKSFLISLETVLAGHEGPVYSVRFISQDSILTASQDKTIIVWGVGDDDIWTETTRVGEVGGNNLGFMGSAFPRNHEFRSFAGHSHNGAIHIWKKSEGKEFFSSGTGFGGHYNQVVDVAWEPTGKYLVSTSSDETTRLHARCLSKSWHEIARPQVHGYEINCLAVIDGYSFVTGADEKVLRVFRATKNFVNSFNRLTGATKSLVSRFPVENLPLGSSMPALGLTNRAVYEKEVDGYLESGTAGDEDKTGVPTEEALMQSTLWPEIHKLYGHGNELFAVAVNHRKTIVASGCKSAKAEQAALITWKVDDEFRICQKLPGHQLTVTSIKFSPNDKFLVSVSRDRMWYLYRENQPDEYDVVSFSDKKTCLHSRIIWDVSWTPDGSHFLTCSRDKKLIFWQVNEKDAAIEVLPLKDAILSQDHAVMSCDILDRKIDDQFIVAFGLENGFVSLYRFSLEKGWHAITFLAENILRHHLSIRKVRFEPQTRNNDEICLASCGDDRMVQIFRITL